MKPTRVDLDHLRRTPPADKASWLLLAIAIVFAAHVGFSYAKTRLGIDTKTARLARVSSAQKTQESAMSAPVRATNREEFTSARDTISRLSLPWSNVFRALEAARSDDIALLSIEPDAESGAVNITAQARDYPTALTYVAWLSHGKTLRNVRLAKHEFMQNEPRRPVLFTLSADWKEGG